MIAIEKVRDLLAAHDAIEFALLFGSFARGKPKPWSDVDIAIFVGRTLDLLEIGQLTATLECSLGRTVDVLILNTALEHHPALAYNVIAEGCLLFCRRREAFVDCKTKIILRYLDTAFLRSMVARAFEERLNTGRFGTGETHA
ncbi:MAG: nucleotidyltransferase domain-containing protein [Roseiflexus castenholzii]|uniref:type VII toxin-antitoxin system MntA family adenylyltransferase antitoxin n=1 Tax=Roseiflexus castenholzii TaxID=120962 RepID=UPI000CADC6C6|nr:MAG: nucleotidyltransferase domain-containing protein [Roseiflexus castenholzii]